MTYYLEKKFKGRIMSQNWICVTNRTNFERVLKHKRWGVAERYKKEWEATRIDDTLIFYIIGDQVLGGILKVSKSPFRETKRIFEGGTYPFRMEVAVMHLPDNPIPFSAEIRDTLELIKNKRIWSGPLRRAMVCLSEKDFKTLSDAITRK